MKLRALEELLKKSWSKESSVDENWSIDNPALGQGTITALLVNLCCGGKIMRCMSSTGSHYYNLINDKIVDLTRSQFGNEEPQYEIGEERTREYLLSNDNTKRRYKILLEKVKSNLIYTDFYMMDSDGKDYSDSIIMFTSFEIDSYESSSNLEKVRFSLKEQNLGLVFEAEHILSDDIYVETNYPEINMPREVLEVVFSLARRYKRNLELENILTAESSKVKIKNEK